MIRDKLIWGTMHYTMQNLIKSLHSMLDLIEIVKSHDSFYWIQWIEGFLVISIEHTSFVFYKIEIVQIEFTAIFLKILIILDNLQNISTNLDRDPIFT